MPEEMVTITRSEYEDLLETQRWAEALENAGVDNWKGYDYARELFHSEDEDEDED